LNSKRASAVSPHALVTDSSLTQWSPAFSLDPLIAADDDAVAR
jgi:hypothetical protein